MISIIICSRSQQMITEVEANVKETVGVPYEIIGIDNSNRKYGICEAYNIGASQSKFDYLCFMHEDIKFLTSDWGKIVVELLQKSETGVLGVAGSTYQPKAPSGWGGASRTLIALNVVHTARGKTQHDYYNPSGKQLIKAATLDGLWLCCRKMVWEEFRFDAVAFPGFHFYDIDFCTRVSTKYVNYITFDILIEHFSHGTFDKVWIHNAIMFYKKRKNYLPVDTNNLSRTEKDFLNLAVLQAFTQFVIDAQMPKSDVIFCVLECLKLSPLNRDNAYLLRKALKIV